MKKLMVTGNVGRDSESRADQSGNTFATFSVAVSVGTKLNPKTDWVEVSCNGKLAEVALNYVKKGTKVLVEGYPTATAYMTRENKPAASLRLYANTLELLSRREDSDQHHADDHNQDPVYNLPEAGQSTGGGSSMSLKSDDIPF